LASPATGLPLRDTMSSSHSATIGLFFIRPVVRLLSDRGVDADEFLARYGLGREEILRGDGRIDVAVGARMLNALSTLLGEPAIGLTLARYVDYASFGPLGAAFAAGGQLRDVFGRCVRFSSLVTDAIDVRFEETDTVASLTIAARDGAPIHPQAILLTLAITRGFITARLENLPPLLVVVRDVDEACRVAVSAYLRCPVEFGEEFRIDFSTEAVGKVLAGSDGEIAAAIDRTLSARLDRGEPKIVSELSTWVETHLSSGEPSLDEAATALRTTPRSLQRRLKAEHMTWQRVVDDTRRRLAEGYVREPGLSFTEVSFRLGFADLSSFSRSFRKWYGVSASDFRGSIRTTGRSAR